MMHWGQLHRSGLERAFFSAINAPTEGHTASQRDENACKRDGQCSAPKQARLTHAPGEPLQSARVEGQVDGAVGDGRGSGGGSTIRRQQVGE
eukprot:CAMPEP_0181193304 /NCGR_PEP_ID=MMETSP1096-20121128/13748_1 /TAXON_ID=156174 ORGANISM="Chrysochromulina ericina, Strain CCMP281" /NCGR_SAMPLE_ID=MMETSP1096 /ASSEMBLY_ACC=CAM_ASM_000453 /LENGTH=91 /DNA_ID=CAMNT_0023282763 /DNA_START=86 /DNA_END=362 /DNA_ORIENTATION=+